MRTADSDRLCWGTLTRLPVRPPSIVDTDVAGGAMLSAPLVGAALGVAGGLIAWACWVLRPDALGALLGAALAVGLVAWLTRGLHLDGLADTMDALGSGKPADQALAIARKSDIGPFGVISLVLVLLIDVVALAASTMDGIAMLALVVALVAGRLALPLACMKGIKAARPDGLGAAVAGSVHPGAAAAVLAGWLIIISITGAVVGGDTWGSVVLACIGSIVAGLVAAVVLLLIARRRLGGITGDVLGAMVEIATAASLITLALS